MRDAIGLPVGVQVVSLPYQEEVVLRIMRVLENCAGFIKVPTQELHTIPLETVTTNTPNQKSIGIGTNTTGIPLMSNSSTNTILSGTTEGSTNTRTAAHSEGDA